MKKFISIILILSFFVCFSGCNGTDNQESAVSSESSSNESVSLEASSKPEASQENTSMPESGASAEESFPMVEPTPEDVVVSFIACADNLVHHSMYYDALERAAERDGVTPEYTDLHNNTYDFSPIYSLIAEDVKNADISYINQESLIGGDSKPISAYPRFNTPVPMANAVKDVGFDVVNVAHNHMLDSGNTDFLKYSYNLFENLGVKVLGYYPDEKSTEDILIIERQGIKVAFLTYTYDTNGIKNKDDFVIPYFERELMEKQVALAKEKADIVIASCHWGNEYSFNPNKMQKENAKLLCELGVDVIVGMHPHCIQPMEWLTAENGHKTLVTYSLGTMVSGIRKGMSTLAGMLSFDIIRDGISGEVYIDSPLFIPTVAHYTRGKSVADNDSGSRNFTVYPLADYTQDIAKEHSLVRAEKKDGTTLVGGGFSRETLLKTVRKYIPEEFLPELGDKKEGVLNNEIQ
ncbi:MAG: CapA family protein [Ruminococcaceae bacterium]|nr:CapA family protein [Oscillospiraceae bacterium]